MFLSIHAYVPLVGALLIALAAAAVLPAPRVPALSFDHRPNPGAIVVVAPAPVLM